MIHLDQHRVLALLDHVPNRLGIELGFEGVLCGAQPPWLGEHGPLRCWSDVGDFIGCAPKPDLRAGVSTVGNGGMRWVSKERTHEEHFGPGWNGKIVGPTLPLKRELWQPQLVGDESVAFSVEPVDSTRSDPG